MFFLYSVSAEVVLVAFPVVELEVVLEIEVEVVTHDAWVAAESDPVVYTISP